MVRQIILSLTVILTSLFSYAQTATILNEGEAKIINIDYNNSANSNYNQQFLKILSETYGGNTELVKLEYKVKEYHSITQRGTKIHLSAAIGNIVLQGEHNYKKFSVNHILIPSQINFTYHWVDSNGVKIESVTLTNQSLKSGTDVIKINKPANAESGNSKFYLSDVQFIFSKSDFKKFDVFIDAINNYYDADAHLNMVGQDLNKIRTDSLELLDEFYDITLNNVKYFTQLKAQRLNSKLSLTTSDPIGLKSHLGKTEVRNRELKKKLEYTQKNMHEAYYKKGVDWLNWKDDKKATSLFMKSINERNIYAPPFYELAKLDFKNYKYQAVLDTCATIISSKKPNNDTRYNTLNLAEKVILIYLDSTIALVNDNHYEAALSKLQYCKDYISKVEGMRNFPEFNEIETKIFTGYYKALATSVQESIQQESLKEAQKGIDSLISFRLANKQFYIEPTEEQQLLNNLYTAYLTKGEDYLNTNQADSAIFCLTNAKIICSQKDFVDCTDDITKLLNKAYTENYKQLLNLAEIAISDELADSATSLIKLANQQQIAYNLDPLAKSDTLFIQAKQLKYKGLILEGNNALNGGDGKQALAFYQEAIEIDDRVDIKGDTSLNSKAKDAASAYILMICSSCETFVETMQMDKAQAGFYKAKNLEKSYKLNERLEIIEAIEHLASLLNQGKCSVSQYEFNVQLRTAQKFVDKIDFENAQNAIKKAKTIANENADCNIDLSALDKLHKSIYSISNYTEQFKQINQDIEKKKFNPSIHAYLALTNYYNDSVKNNYGIEHSELFEFVNENKNSDFINFAAQYYIEQSEAENALELLNELYRRDYIASWSKESQEELGTYYANRDFEKDAELDPKLMVSNYTNDLPWFKHLKQAYLKQWKSLYK